MHNNFLYLARDIDITYVIRTNKMHTSYINALI